jgi:hypothetical protein
MATGYCVLLGMHHLKFGIQAYLWVSPVVVALILSGFVCHIWRVIQGTFLGWLFPFNPNFLVNEKRFKDQLKLKLSEVKRYGGPFAVMAISLDRKKELIKKYGRRGWQNLNEEIMFINTISIPSLFNTAMNKYCRNYTRKRKPTNTG